MSIIYVYAFITLFTIITGYVLMQRMGLNGIGVSWLCAQGIGSVGLGIANMREEF